MDKVIEKYTEESNALHLNKKHVIIALRAHPPGPL